MLATRRANILWLTSLATRGGTFGLRAQLGGLLVDQMMHPGPKKKDEPPANHVAGVKIIMLCELKLIHLCPGAGVVFERVSDIQK